MFIIIVCVIIAYNLDWIWILPWITWSLLLYLGIEFFLIQFFFRHFIYFSAIFFFEMTSLSAWSNSFNCFLFSSSFLSSISLLLYSLNLWTFSSSSLSLFNWTLFLNLKNLINYYLCYIYICIIIHPQNIFYIFFIRIIFIFIINIISIIIIINFFIIFFFYFYFIII